MKFFRKKRIKSRPGICITQREKLDYNPETFENQKRTITPKTYDFETIASYLDEHYDLKEKTLAPIQIEIFKANLQDLDYYDKKCFLPIFLCVVRNEKSNDIYRDFPEDENIYVYIEKNSGYIETNSGILQKKLFEIRGVTQEEYDRNSQKLYELIGATFLNS